MKEYIPATMKELILGEIQSTGPICFKSIMKMLKVQCSDKRIYSWNVAHALTELIIEKKVQLYDDGESFFPYVEE